MKVGLARDNPRLATVATVWRTAIWQEREIFDLLGVVFAGHPTSAASCSPRIGSATRSARTYVEPTEYHGISTKRESML